MTARVRVLVVDDQTLVRQGVRSLLALSEHVEVVGEAGEGRQALELIATSRPDVVLLDLRMPGLDGLGVLRELTALTEPMPAVIVLTTFADDDALFEAVGLGAKGYLLKDVSLDQLVQAIADVAAGGSLVQPVVTEALTRRVQGRPRVEPEVAFVPELTARELDVLRLVAGGYSNREIGRALHLAEGTVKNHVSAVLVKLGTRDRTRAALKALELGLV